MTAPSIVVLTPLRNDAWILRHFLAVTSTFADRILVADQGSTDGGPGICAEFPKVAVLDNAGGGYDEASRQQLLIAAARELVPGPRLLVALDADEILAADAVESPGWQRMLAAPPGTLVLFEKPNVLLATSQVERGAVDFAGAFADDGSPHRPTRIHSTRLPQRDDTPLLALDDVKVLHYALVRPQAQKAKRRMYAALENVMGTKSLYQRRRYYWSRMALQPVGRLEPLPEAWLAGWQRRGIDVTRIADEPPYWQDLATLDLLLEHGSRRFWLDDVWEQDWRRLLREQGLRGRVVPPPRILVAALNAAQSALERAAATRRRVRTGLRQRRNGHGG